MYFRSFEIKLLLAYGTKSFAQENNYKLIKILTGVHIINLCEYQ